MPLTCVACSGNQRVLQSEHDHVHTPIYTATRVGKPAGARVSVPNGLASVLSPAD